MTMSNEVSRKLSRYFINADPFLWNLLDHKNKKGRLKELQELGFLESYSPGSNFSYAKYNQDLLVNPGIEGILEYIVVPRVKILFSQDILGYFRRCWEQGQTPTLDYLRKHGLYKAHRFTNEEVYDSGWKVPPVVGHKEPAFIFFQIDTQHDFIERWTVFAGLWFEEIEPLVSALG